MPETSRRSVLGMLAAAPLTASGLAATAGSADAQATRSPGGQDEALRAYERYVSQLAEQGKFNGVILAAHRGRPVVSRAFGMADQELGVRNKIGTRFNLASGSKPFTTLAIVQLAEQGKLEFYEKLGTYLDGFPADVAGTVTVHQLLTHTSGMTSGPVDLERIMNSKEEVLAVSAAALRQGKLEFTPGTRFQYGGAGLDVLGEIVAAVSGQPFWDYVHEHLFGAAGMTGAKYYTRAEWLADPRIAHPYMLQADGSRLDGLRNLKAGTVLGAPGSNAARAFIGLGGGGGFAGAPDLVRFAQALQGHELLSRPYTELYISPKYPATPPQPAPSPGPARREAFQAYGLISSIQDDWRIIGHGGGLGGVSTNWSIYLDQEWVSVVLSNYDLEPKLLQDILHKEREAVTYSQPGLTRPDS